MSDARIAIPGECLNIVYSIIISRSFLTWLVHIVEEVAAGDDGAEAQPIPSQTSAAQEPPALVVSSDSVSENAPVNQAAESSGSPSGGNAPSNEPLNTQAEEGESQAEETSQTEAPEEKPEQKSPVSIFLQTAEFLLDVNALQVGSVDVH